MFPGGCLVPAVILSLYCWYEQSMPLLHCVSHRTQSCLRTFLVRDNGMGKVI